jgi:hypothetical protein
MTSETCYLLTSDSVQLALTADSEPARIGRLQLDDFESEACNSESGPPAEPPVIMSVIMGRTIPGDPKAALDV